MDFSIEHDARAVVFAIFVGRQCHPNGRREEESRTHKVNATEILRR